jgi:Xaa-Pro aminopeptidase
MQIRLAALRKRIKDLGLAAFIVPHADEHQSETTPGYAERLGWLTGFKGSAGEAAVTLKEAAIFVDGRYTLQVRAQVKGDDFEYLRLYQDRLDEWLAAQLKSGERVGYDAWLVTKTWAGQAQKTLAAIGAELVAVEENLIDQIWQDQPAASIEPAVAHPLKYAGETHQDKCSSIGQALKEKGADAFILTSLVSICWLLNIRGRDVANTPLVLSYAILKSDGSVKLFIDPRKLTNEVKNHLGKDVTYFAKDEITSELQKMNNQTVLVDEKITSAAVFNILKGAGASIITGDDPTALPRALKNKVEIAGTKAAHIRDAAALCKFYRWIDEEGPRGRVTEMSAVEKLYSLRQELELFQGNSFDTISGAGANGAVIHYRVTEGSSQPLKTDMIYLCDSGGQYLDGTTDITRTIAVGQPTAEQKDRFTRVLKGHIALASARFPAGRTGSHLDSLARSSLWEISQDYDHGTGHGVGSYLSVHEGPQSISAAKNNVPLQAGMIVSNEPGFYKAGEYGIRTENLVIVTEIPAAKDARAMLGFETITFVPIDQRLIDQKIMTAQEIKWLNGYHAQVLSHMEKHLTGADLDWVRQATEVI